MRAQYIPCIIFSVDQADLDHKHNVMAQKQVENDLRAMGINYERMLGVYQGNEETSYLVTDMSAVSIILGIAREFNQDSILLRDNENNASLKFFDGRQILPLGKLNAVSIDEAVKSDAYTYSYRLKQYFVCS